MASLCFVLGLSGCATKPVDWPARVGHYTYEQAVGDMGTPEKQDKLADGSVVAEWLTGRGYSYTPSSSGLEDPLYRSRPETFTAPSRFVRLTFGPDGRLKAWKELYK